MAHDGWKLEIEAVSSIQPRYLGDVYIRRKLAALALVAP
jgi:hypothetical protein